MKHRLAGLLGAVAVVLGGAVAVQAQSISDVENARAKDRAGYYVNRQDREKLRQYGGNDDYGYGGYGYDGYYDGPAYGGGGVSVYVGPGHDYDPYDD